MADMSQRVPRPYSIYAVVVGLLGGLTLLLSWVYAAPQITPVLLVLLVSALVAESLALELPSGAIYSLSYPLTMAAAVMYGPAAAGLAALLSSFNVADLRRKKPVVVYVFNAGQLAISACAAAWLYLALGGQLFVSDAGQLASSGAIVPLLACAVTSVLLNDVLVSYGIHLYFEVPWTKVTSNEVAWMAPSQLVLAAVGFAMAEVLSINPWAVVLFIFPFLVARQVFQRYSSLRDAYLDTVRSLVAAIEAKDPYTRGHSERVTKYAGLLGSAIDMRQAELERLEYAALLHDVGKIGVPGRVLTKAGKLSEEEYARIKEHPRVGAQIVSRVPYLADIVEAVLHHHEHFDGTGYGLGASGSAIPQMARVLSVVDAFDAMTSERPYRPALSVDEATTELTRCSGTQFDPELVEVFSTLVSDGRLAIVPGDRDSGVQPDVH